MNPVVAAAGELLPRRSDYRGLGQSWRADVVAGITVAIVALPLALGFGVASGLTAEAGLVTAIVAGLVAAVFGGSHVQVSGPTGAMAVVLLPIVANHGPATVALVGLMAGALIVLAALLRLGRAVTYIPWPVIEGFTLGIGTIIFLQQVPIALGVERPAGDNTALVALKTLRNVGADIGTDHLQALGIVALVAAIMLGSHRLHRALPGSLIAIVVATVVSDLAGLNLAGIDALPGSLPTPHLPDIELGPMRELFTAAVAVAALAAIESLLSARVADGMIDRPPHHPDRELLGQGLANIAAPMMGGIPATGAIARTAVNVRAGARTRLASIVHSLVLAAVVLVGAGLVSRIPLAALAGVLMVTAVRMVDRRNVLSVLRSTRSDALVLIVTAATTVVFDLIVAIEVGMVAAAVLALRMLVRTSAVEDTAHEVFIDHEPINHLERALLHEHIAVYRLDGALFFAAAQRFLTTLSRVGDVRVVILRLKDLNMLDATGAQALGQIVETLENRGITVLLNGPRPQHVRLLRAVGALDRLAHHHHLFHNLDRAVAHARTHVARALAGAV